MVRRLFLLGTIAVLVINILLSFFIPNIWWDMLFFGPLILVGFMDMIQTKKAVLRNFPVIGNLRYLMEAIRPEINQYFVESNSSGMPFSREERSVVYQRAKGVRDTLPFGTQRDVYSVGYEWVNHSIVPCQVKPEDLRVVVGGPDCKQLYNASVLNISAMSFGSINKNAVLALNQGARLGNFAHNTGEGGLSSYHVQGGGDIIWQIGTGYFGCRMKEGKFCAQQFAEKSQIPNVKMIEIKISQGAKPGKGGILPAAKVSAEIARIRGVAIGEDVISPPAHSAFKTPLEMCEFIARLRELSKGKPIGFKICIGRRSEFISICKAMVQTGITPDFITIDGGEGGTGAAPLEFSNHLGSPLTEGLIFAHNCLVGFGLRSKIKVFASGKVITGFGMIHHMALGADIIYSARGMMFALGCIQALKCDSNKCPTGITTQDEGLMVGLVVEEKNKRVASFHEQTVKSLSQMIGAMGLHHTSELRPWHIMRRVSNSRVKQYDEIYRFLKEGELLREPLPPSFERACKLASAEKFN